VAVGIGQLAVSCDPNEILVAYGLGSCVGVSVVDEIAKVAGLAHVLLPDSGGKPPDAREPGRFADTGIDALVQAVTAAGAAPGRLIVKLAGGASVLGPANAEKFKIGERNAEAIRERLKRHGLFLAASDLGGARGRTLEVHTSSGKTFVRTAASAAAELQEDPDGYDSCGR
jgi:chemotaxis protein CheD